jgi:hypothetical protein
MNDDEKQQIAREILNILRTSHEGSSRLEEMVIELLVDCTITQRYVEKIGHHLGVERVPLPHDEWLALRDKMVANWETAKPQPPPETPDDKELPPRG